jgi:hypothetical protein
MYYDRYEMLGKFLLVKTWNALQYIHYAGIVYVDPECQPLLVAQET